MRRQAYQLCLALAVIPLPDGAKAWIVLGAGPNSCGQWTQDKAANSNLRDLDVQWLLGFVSAYNFYESAKGDETNGPDNQGLISWVDNYCAQHPLEQISTAAIELVTELTNRNKP